MRPALLAIPLVIVASAWRAPTRPEEPGPPTPPRQAEPWTPPATSLPRFLVSATSTLFEQGLADPRGCEYRTIQVSVGSVWGDEAHDVATSGWVFPAAEGGKSRHAIAWNGLVYPLTGVGKPADLEADVRALVDLAGGGKADVAPEARPAVREGFHASGTNREESSIAVATLHPIKVCLLLRVGRAGLAESVWSSGTGLPKGPGPAPKLDLNTYGVSYLSLAGDLAWYHFDRATCAHMRGEDPLALADVRFLDRFSRAVDARAEEMGFARPNRPSRAGRPTPYIEFLGQLPAFLADQERRARERAHPPAPAGGPAREARVATLIRDLDQVAARQWSQPGGVALGQSPIVEALIAEGDPAVDPLLHALRSDDRLTRSVGFGRDFFRYRDIKAVHQAAFSALMGIVKKNFTPPSPEGVGGEARSRAAVADEIQAYWEKNRAIPLAERWYRTLADDGAGIPAWLEAAGNIIRPELVRTVAGGGAIAAGRALPSRPVGGLGFRGEPLRRGHDPSVSSLMARRVGSMMKSSERQGFGLLDACQMAGMLAEWEPVAALPTLRDLTRACRERYARLGDGDNFNSQGLASSIARFTLAREGAGDLWALREYAEWIRTTSPDRLDYQILAILEPLRRRPDDPDLAAAAAWLFEDPRSPWIPLIGRKGPNADYHLSPLIASPMVEVPAFRRMLLKSLDDRSRAGKAEAGVDGLVNVQLVGGFSTGRSMTGDVRDEPARGISVPIRICDFFAWQLATREGAPAFHPAWPEPRRDAALASMAAFLKGKGGR